MFKLALAALIAAVVSVMAGEMGYTPVLLGRTMFVVFFVTGAVCFSLGLISQADPPKEPPPFFGSNPPDQQNDDVKRAK